MVRQKTYDIFIKPYTEIVQGTGSGIVIHKDSVYIAGGKAVLQGGECWMLYKGDITSLSIAQKEIKNLMDTLGYPRDAIKLRQAVPLDYVIAPLR